MYIADIFCSREYLMKNLWVYIEKFDSRQLTVEKR